MPRGDTAPGASAESDCTGAPPPATPLTADQFLWLAGSLCQLHRVPFDAALLAQRHVPPYTAAQL